MLPGVLVHHPDVGARGSASLSPLPASGISGSSGRSGRLGRSQSRAQLTHPLMPLPLGRAARLTHRIRQRHVAGPLLSQRLMHGESCPVALATEAASCARTQGAPQSILHCSCRFRSLAKLRETASGCKLQPKCRLPLPSLLPPSALGDSSIGDLSSGLRLRKHPPPPISAPPS